MKREITLNNLRLYKMIPTMTAPEMADLLNCSVGYARFLTHYVAEKLNRPIPRYKKQDPLKIRNSYFDFLEQLKKEVDDPLDFTFEYIKVRFIERFGKKSDTYIRSLISKSGVSNYTIDRHNRLAMLRVLLNKGFSKDELKSMTNFTDEELKNA